MKKLLFFALTSAAIPCAMAQYKADESRQAAITAIKKDSSKVKDALWTSATRLKIGVLDDGTPRHGFASYTCGLLTELGFTDIKVTVDVIDIAKLVQTNKWHTLGTARCQ